MLFGSDAIGGDTENLIDLLISLKTSTFEPTSFIVLYFLFDKARLKSNPT